MLQDQFALANVSASAAFSVIGGRYLVAVQATFGGGSVKIQKLSNDGSTLLDIKETFDLADGTGTSSIDLVTGTFSANGCKILDLSPGRYQVTITTATAVYVDVARVPLA